MLAGVDAHYLEDAGVAHGVVRGVVGLSGPYYHPEAYRDTRWMEIFSPGGDLDATEPMRFVSADGPALLLLAGAEDSAVPPLLPMVEAARAAGEDVEFRIYEGVDHGGTFRAFMDPSIAPVLEDVSAFVRRVAE
jgi:acetyl esterase/lipase